MDNFVGCIVKFEFDGKKDWPWLRALKTVISLNGGVVMKKRTRFKYPEEFNHLLPQ